MPAQNLARALAHGERLLDDYPARVELRLFDAYLPAIAAALGPGARVVELGTRVAIRTKRLFAALDRPIGYVAIRSLHEALVLPPTIAERTLLFVPGIAIDRVEPHAAIALLAAWRERAEPTWRLLVGADGTRDRAALASAYDGVWNERCSRIESCDGNTYKHELHAMRGMLRAAGWDVCDVFTGKERPMRLWLCEPAEG